MTDPKHPENTPSLEQEFEQGQEAIEQAEIDATQEIDALTKAQAKAAEHWDRLLRLQAEVENMKRRAERDLSHAHKFATEKFVRELLPVVDSLEIALQAETQADNKTLHEGLALTHSLLVDALAKQHVKAIDPEGEPFDPSQHEAISTQSNADVENNTVLKVMQKGYTLNARLIRPALVVVSQ